MTPTPPVTRQSHHDALTRLRDAWWRRHVAYPAAGTRYVPTDTRDLLAQMRGLMRVVALTLVGFGALLVALLCGLPLPSWTTTALALFAVAGFYLTVPDAAAGARSMILWQTKPTRTEEWMDAGVAFGWVARMSRSPVGPEVFGAYAAALGGAPSHGIPVHAVWAMHERGVSPQMLHAYVTADLPADGVLDLAFVWGHATTPNRDAYRSITADEAIAIAEVGYTPEQWRLLRLDCPDTAVTTLLTLAVHLRFGRGSLHPDQFPTAHAIAPRGCTEIHSVLTALVTNLSPLHQWRPVVDCHQNGVIARRGRCATCYGTQATGHRRYRAHPLDSMVRRHGLDNHTIGEWLQATGTLAPDFIGARFDFDHAAAMCRQHPAPTPATIQTLAALRTDL